MAPNESRPDNVSSPAFEAQKALYLQSAKLRNLSPLTVRQLDLSMRTFIAFARSQGVTEAQGVDGALVERYKTHLMNRVTRRGTPLGVSTLGERLYTVRCWFDLLRKKGHLSYNPAKEVSLPRRAKKLPRGVLRPDEIEKLLSLPNLKVPLGYRDRTMMELLYASGARAAELCGIRVGDLDLSRKVVKVLGKGGKQRLVPLTTTCCRFIERYIDDIRPELVAGVRFAGNNWLKQTGTAEDRLFVSAYGGLVKPNWLGSIMKRYLFLAGITRPISPVHGFRHSIATHLLGDGMDVRYIQALLGHNSIDTTQIYTHVERDSMRKMVKTYHPLETDRRAAKSFVEDKRHAHTR